MSVGDLDLEWRRSCEKVSFARRRREEKERAGDKGKGNGIE